MNTTISMENGFPKKCDEESLPELPQGLLKLTAQLSNDLCPIMKLFSWTATTTMGKRKGKEKVTQVFSAVQPMNPQTSTNTGVDCIYGQYCRAESSPQPGGLPWRKGVEFSRRKSCNTARLQETPWKRSFHSFAILSPNVGSLYPQIKMFLWVCAFKAWTSHFNQFIAIFC